MIFSGFIDSAPKRLVDTEISPCFSVQVVVAMAGIILFSLGAEEQCGGVWLFSSRFISRVVYKSVICRLWAAV